MHCFLDVTSPVGRQRRINMLRRMVGQNYAFIRENKRAIGTLRFIILPELRAEVHRLIADEAAHSLILIARRAAQAQVLEIESLQEQNRDTTRVIRGLQARIRNLQNLVF